ncbi:MAG TPA: M56 family metallopeptidase [Puia sp.]
MIPYILYATGITTICFFFYKLLLQKETFYRWNRWMLMGCLAVSFLLPLLPAPRGWSWKVGAKIVPSAEIVMARLTVEEPKAGVQPLAEQVEPVFEQFGPVEKATPLLAKKVKGRKHVMQEKATDRPVVAAVSPAVPHVDGQAASPETEEGIDWRRLFSLSLRWIFYVYCFGVVFFGASFLIQLVVLLFQSYANPVIRDGRFRIVEMSGNRAPCSFGNTIFINPANYDWETYNQILIHEKTHVSGRHTVDILLAELAVVVQWFNPFAWLYRREVENNLEFLTDEAVLLHREVERSAYQLSLLRVSAPHLPFSITNNYNQSLLKRRIVMMNSKPSSRYTVWKYFFLLPIFIGLVCVLNEPLAYGQEVRPAVSATPAAKAAKAAKATPAAAVRPAEKAKAATPATAVSVAPAAEPAVRVVEATQTLQDNSQVSVVLQNQVAVATPMPSLAGVNVNVAQGGNVNVAPFMVFMEEITDGSWFVTTNEDKLYFELKAEDDEHSWSNSLRAAKSEITPFPGTGNVSFKLVRDAGTMTFTGQFDGQQGFGRFHFQPDESFGKALEQMGVAEMEDRKKLSFFVVNLKKDYADMVLHNGYPHISSRNLLAFASMHVDQDFIQYWRNSGIDNIEDPRTLITLKAMKIDKAYVEELKAAGYDHLSARQLSSLKSQHIDGAYAKSMGRGKDNEIIPVEQLVSYKAMNIDADYINSLKKVGYDNLDRRDITSLYSMKVTADYIKGFQDIGLKDLQTREIMQLKSQGVTPEYVKNLRDQGYKDLHARDIVQFKAMKITPEFAKGFRDIGYDDLSPSRLNSLKAMGITPEYVGEFKKLGFSDIPVSMLTSLKSTGVNAEYISKMREKGFVTNDLNKYIRLKRDFE